MTLQDLFLLADEARKLSGHTDYVIVGSLSALGIEEHSEIPEAMLLSNDVDCYTRNDPERIFDLEGQLGAESAFFNEHQFYLDPVTPKLLTVPHGWEARMPMIERGDIRLWFLDADDAAISKYARGEPRDLRWIRAGIASGIVSMPTVKTRLRTTAFLDQQEDARVRNQVEDDSAWFETVKSKRFSPR